MWADGGGEAAGEDRCAGEVEGLMKRPRVLRSEALSLVRWRTEKTKEASTIAKGKFEAVGEGAEEVAAGDEFFVRADAEGFTMEKRSRRRLRFP